MRLVFSKQVRDQFDDQSRRDVKPMACDCCVENVPCLVCEMCAGEGIVWYRDLEPDVSAAIEDNLSRQGVPIHGRTH